MKNYLKHKAVIIPVVFTALAVIITGTVYAATTLSVPGKVTVVTATCDIKVFSDAEGRYELTGIEWNDLPQGGKRYQKVYLQNIGNSDADVTIQLVNPPSGVTLELESGEEPILLERGKTAPVELTLKADKAALLGGSLATFSVSFSSVVHYEEEETEEE